MPKSNDNKELDKVVSPTFEGQEVKEIEPLAFLATSQSPNGDYAIAEPACLPLETQPEYTRVFSWEQLNKILVNLNKLLLAGLVTFEALNALGILQYHVSFHWIALLITTGGVWALLKIIFFYARTSSKTVSNILMLATVAALYADTLGQVFSLFDRIEWYDQILHFFAGGALYASIIFLLIQSLGVRGKISLGILTTAFFAWTSTLSLGLFYEFGELILDKITGSNSLVSLSDTINDLLLDTFGSLSILVILVIYFYYVSRRSRSADKNPAPEAANT